MGNITDTYFSELAPRVFYKLSELKRLDLSGNPLDHVDGDVFMDVPALEEFRCAGCGLFQIRLPPGLHLIKLKTLNLRNNTFERLDGLDDGFMGGLRSLDLSLNKLDKLDKVNATALKTLNLARNTIKEVASCALCNTSIQDLDLAHNKIIALHQNILSEYGSAKSLSKLRISGNWIPADSLANFLFPLENLEEIQLDHVGLVNLPNYFFDGEK